MVQRQCQYCGKEYEAKKKNGRFCSSVCRVNFNRAKERGFDKRALNPFPASDLPANYFEMLLRRQKCADLPAELKKNPMTPDEAIPAKNEGKHPLWKQGDPKEGSMGFYNKYDCASYEELAKLKNQ